MEEKDSEQANNFTMNLKVVKKVKYKKNLVTTGDLAKTESAALESNFHQKQIEFTEN